MTSFKPQPELAKGAKAYFLSNVLPDWPNEEAKIKIREATAVDFVLLVNENTLPDTNVPCIL